jgi:hypothetical protein
LNGYSDVGELKEAPVKGEDGEFRECDGERVSKARRPHMNPSQAILVLKGEVVGKSNLHGFSKSILDPNHSIHQQGQ